MIDSSHGINFLSPSVEALAGRRDAVDFAAVCGHKDRVSKPSQESAPVIYLTLPKIMLRARQPKAAAEMRKKAAKTRLWTIVGKAFTWQPGRGRAARACTMITGEGD